MKRFNINGLCMPEKHYMVDLSQRVLEIDRTLIELGEYFTINRARQYGKTTTLQALEKYLSTKYIVVRISFEGLDDSILRNTTEFIRAFIFACASQLARAAVGDVVIKNWKADLETFNLRILRDRITKLVCACNKPIILMIDEVDKSSDNKLFLSFLGMLRDKHLTRTSYGNNEYDATFQSVILAGVYDIKNLKLKIRPEEEHSYNSPWNIAAPFNLDMSFSDGEIARMLAEYETDHHTGMDIQSIANEIRRRTSGYPFLVSLICKTIDEQLDRNWSLDGIQSAVKRILHDTNTLFDDMTKKLSEHLRLGKLVEAILVGGTHPNYEIENETIRLGVTFGILAERDKSVVISNLIFEKKLYSYFVSRAETERLINPGMFDPPSAFIKNGRIDMVYAFQQFAAAMKRERRKENSSFVETDARLLFIMFISSIVNSTGSYDVESQTRNNMRMDIKIHYLRENYIIELKIWRGKQMEQDAYEQLAGYLDAQGKREGYLLVFCDNKTQPEERGWVEYNGYRIYETIVPFLEEA
ncbi:hypothetical protein AGMMS49992_28320 [Clostridia bacterium]|nr:hypothetical protein AGMMS49992_28320 [Clostridia bacterium]